MVHTNIIHSKPAIVLEGKNRNLIVTDLHIGFENELAANDIFIGKNTIADEFTVELEAIIDMIKPESLILLGDIKSSLKFISKNEWDEIPFFFERIMKRTNVILIPGNHDSNIQRLVPEGVVLSGATGMILENTLLTHGHTLPADSFAHVDRIIMGHIHPVFFQESSIVNGQRVWVSILTEKKQIFPTTTGTLEIIIVPSFNRYFYATKKKYYKKSISPIIEKIKEITSAKIVTLDGSIIGDETMLSHVI